MKEAEVAPILSGKSTLHATLIRSDVDFMSTTVFGVPYGAIKALLYPRPAYKYFAILKRDGSFRHLQEPRSAVKELQYKCLAFLEEIAPPPKPCVHGFVPGRSIVTNARAHLKNRPYHLLNLDLKDFFPSITFFRVRGVLLKPPFSFAHPVATVLAHLCTLDNQLPQGAPTSPFLANQVCRSLDQDLTSLAKRHRATYTRYADDISISFSTRNSANLPEGVVSFDGGEAKLGREVLTLIEADHNFRINAAKTRLSTRRSRMEVTGLTINEMPNVRRDFLDRIRGALRAWSTHGYIAAQNGWISRISHSHYPALWDRGWHRQTRSGHPPELKKVLWGRLLYVRMVRGKDDAIYTRLAEKYNDLCSSERGANPSFSAPKLPVEQIVRNAEDAELAVFVLEWTADFYPTAGSGKGEMVGGQGTAFAYLANDLLVTCDHVLTWIGMIDGKEDTVRFDATGVRNLSFSVSNPSDGTSFSANLLFSDSYRDLALLRISGGAAKRRFSGVETPMHKNANGALIGYPNWTPGRTANRAAAAIASRYPRSGLQRFEISAPVRKGNSGGPYVDELFRVAGVAQQGATQDGGNDECLCIKEVDAWLAST